MRGPIARDSAQGGPTRPGSGRSVGSGRDRRVVDDGRRGLPVHEEAIEQGAELLDGAQVQLEVEAVLAGDVMALANLGDLLGELGDPRELPRRGLTRTIAVS
jgi:hypothetical protein